MCVCVFGVGVYVAFNPMDMKSKRIHDAILKRANLCMFDPSTGKKYYTVLETNKKETYHPCSGKRIIAWTEVYVLIKLEKEYYSSVCRVKRDGSIVMDNHMSKVKTNDGKNYISYNGNDFTNYPKSRGD